MSIPRFAFSTLLPLIIAASSLAAAENVCVIPGRGSFRINVDAGGLFGAFAHDHVIAAQKIDGCATVDPKDPARGSVKLTFSAADVRVLDPKSSAEDREKVQHTMDSEVLRISEYPWITFDSTGIAMDSPERLRVRGNLTIRGQTRSVEIPLAVTHLDDGTYRVIGIYKFKQSTFGIEPIRLMAGTVRVKDEIRAEFELFLK